MWISTLKIVHVNHQTGGLWLERLSFRSIWDFSESAKIFLDIKVKHFMYNAWHQTVTVQIVTN